MSQPVDSLVAARQVLEAHAKLFAPLPWVHPSMLQPWPDAASDPCSLLSADRSRQVLNGNWKEVCQHWAYIVAAANLAPVLAEAVSSLRARIEALEAGLKPFAEEACAIWCQRNGCNHGDEQACRYCAARSLLAEAQP